MYCKQMRSANEQAMISRLPIDSTIHMSEGVNVPVERNQGM